MPRKNNKDYFFSQLWAQDFEPFFFLVSIRRVAKNPCRLGLVPASVGNLVRH